MEKLHLLQRQFGALHTPISFVKPFEYPSSKNEGETQMNADITHQVLEKINREKPPIYFSKKPQIKKTPEELVGLGFRFWMAGYQTNDFEFWKKTWDHFNRTIGASAARSTVFELASWAQTVQSSALREIEVCLTEQEQFWPG